MAVVIPLACFFQVFIQGTFVDSYTQLPSKTWVLPVVKME